MTLMNKLFDLNKKLYSPHTGIGFGVISSSIQVAGFDDTDLKAYLKFDETSGDINNVSQAPADLGTAADIQMTGGSFNQAQGPFGYAFLFDGINDFGVFGSSLSQWNFMHNASGLFTINFWARMQAFGENYFLSTVNTDAGHGIFLRTQATNQPLQTFINSGAGSNILVDKTSSNNYLPDTTNWHMYTITWNQSLANTNLSIFRDAANEENANKTAATPSASNNDNALTIGARASDHTKFLNFYISELSIWNRVLSDAEIATLYNSGSGLVIYS